MERADYRRRITGAMRELALTRGLHGVTMDEVAARAGVSKRTVYRYFGGKEEIVAAVLEDLLAEIEGKLQEAVEAGGGPVETITRLVATVGEQVTPLTPLLLHDLQKYYPHLWERLERFRAVKIQQLFERLMRENEHCFRPVNPTIFTAALIAGVRAVANPAFILEHNLSPKETARSLFTIFLHGVISGPPDTRRP